MRNKSPCKRCINCTHYFIKCPRYKFPLCNTYIYHVQIPQRGIVQPVDVRELSHVFANFNFHGSKNIPRWLSEPIRVKRVPFGARLIETQTASIRRTVNISIILYIKKVASCLSPLWNNYRNWSAWPHAERFRRRVKFSGRKSSRNSCKIK